MENQDNLTHYYNFSILTIVLMIVLIPLQTILFILFPHPTTINEWFTLFNNSPIIGFIGFDVFYALSNILMVLFYISLFILIRDKINNLTIFAIILSLVSITIYFSSNRFIEMYTISEKYFKASTEMQRISLIAGGELLLSVYKGSSYFIYYVLSGVSLILLFTSFKRIDFFSKKTVRAGIISGILMLVPATVGIIGMAMSLLSLIPWIVTCLFLISDLNRNRNLER
ncbi:MAG: hypothetical protein K9M49_07135 [Candidatus Marinimicrobia bacterium]|nr:hypothetical protein [Candidatus Neomarinimicrobiota bacterium]MCF7850713.1 hypothetical protein [Candidatus Neomarinimicrobiota bacterium]MCF7904914.1 hypothetical protein [Candidatus Neomarinimicrobiota bacterium]